MSHNKTISVIAVWMCFIWGTLQLLKRGVRFWFRFAGGAEGAMTTLEGR